MPQSDQMKEYLEQVCGQIRWKKAHPVIRKELEEHLQDQAQAFEAEGKSPEKAAELAVKEMGDPVMIGTQFDRSYRPGFNWPILFTILILVAAGIFARWMMDGTESIISSMLTLVLSAAILLIIMKIDYTILSKTWLIYGGYIVSTLAAFLMSNSYGRMTLLPPYFLITAAPITCCSLIYKFRDGGWKNVWLCYLLTLLPMLLLSGRTMVLYWGWLSVLLIMTIAIFTGMFCNLHRKGCTVVSIWLPLPVSVIFIFLTMPEHRLESLLFSLFPQLDPQGYGYLLMTTRYVLSKAKWIGPMENLSEFFTPTGGVDYLLTWLICHFGWICLLAVLALVGVVAVLGIHTFRKQKGILARLVLCAVFSAWMVQMLSAIAVNFGVVSMFSYPFPFFGGNMALIFNSVLLGLLLSVCQMGTLGTSVENRTSGNTELLRLYWFDGTMIRLEISKNRILLEHKQKPTDAAARELKERKENSQFNR